MKLRDSKEVAFSAYSPVITGKMHPFKMRSKTTIYYWGVSVKHETLFFTSNISFEHKTLECFWYHRYKFKFSRKNKILWTKKFNVNRGTVYWLLDENNYGQAVLEDDDLTIKIYNIANTLHFIDQRGARSIMKEIELFYKKFIEFLSHCPNYVDRDEREFYMNNLHKHALRPTNTLFMFNITGYIQ